PFPQLAPRSRTSPAPRAMPCRGARQALDFRPLRPRRGSLAAFHRPCSHAAQLGDIAMTTRHVSITIEGFLVGPIWQPSIECYKSLNFDVDSHRKRCTSSDGSRYTL